MTRGSLGEVLPAPVKTLFVTAATDVGEVRWSGHTLQVPAALPSPLRFSAAAVPAEVTDDFGRVEDAAAPGAHE